MNEQQNLIFMKLKELGNRVTNLGCYVQNDYERLIEDGYATKEDAILSMETLQSGINVMIGELNNTSQAVAKIKESFHERL